MKLTTVFRMAALAAMTCSLQAQAEETLSIYIDNHSSAPQWVAYNAQADAGKAFDAVGIKINWRHGAPKGPAAENERVIAIDITDRTPVDFYPAQLASALPYEGVHIRVLYDRITARVSERNLVAIVLANVMVHEIGHILQGAARHSASGVMKTNWGSRDFVSMRTGVLEFDSFDVKLMRNGMASHAARMARPLN